MGKVIAVVDPETLMTGLSIKQLALLFDQIIAPSPTAARGLGHIPALVELANAYRAKNAEFWHELDWLEEQGIYKQVFPMERGEDLTPESQQARAQFDERMQKLLPILMSRAVQGDRDERIRDYMEPTSAIGVRALALFIRDTAHTTTYPVFPKPMAPGGEQVSTAEVARITLSELPIPDDSTAWEQIIDFRNDGDACNSLVELRDWMAETARGTLNIVEAQDRLESLLSKYRRQLELHRLKSTLTSWQGYVCAGPDFLENLVRMKFGKAAKQAFSIRRERIELLQGELNLPGHEVAYIVKAQETFGL